MRSSRHLISKSHRPRKISVKDHFLNIRRQRHAFSCYSARSTHNSWLCAALDAARRFSALVSACSVDAASIGTDRAEFPDRTSPLSAATRKWSGDPVDPGALAALPATGVFAMWPCGMVRATATHYYHKETQRTTFLTWPRACPCTCTSTRGLVHGQSRQLISWCSLHNEKSVENSKK